ncbi:MULTISPECIES: energy transducer TonB [unclassified Mucilaginibacter]|uniref:energy transducer TonB n=1 Tax=unclassified Mucilaginibacter TaxID=2617802 RepID=UPI0009658086|nr:MULTISPECIES: energy transducer TonB [unclassified Mucilaginibacter]OJW18318.1 MAG: hypothetical protein BGO48_17360 [Mucilaginibacter sp. 44-25]
MKLSLSIFLFLLNAAAFAQHNTLPQKVRPDSLGYYMLNDSSMAYSEADAKFLRLMIKADSGMYRVNDYYMSGNLRLATLTSLDNMNFRPGINGMYYEYYDNGKRKSIKVFDKGKIKGDAVNYYPNGALRSVETYSADGIYLKQFLDSAGNTLTNEGNGKWIKYTDMADERLEGNVVNGREDGEWKRYIGDSVYTITYKKGTIINGKENLLVHKNGFIPVEKTPSFPGGEKAFANFLAKNLRYPKEARENRIQGRVILTFVIERDGSLSNIRVVRDIGGGCGEEAMRVIALSPKWVPGTAQGIPVRVQYAIPIAFSFGN